MIERRELSTDAHAFLDGERSSCADPDEQRVAARLAAAAAAYADSAGVPGPEVDRAVMAAIAARPTARRTVWRWLLRPRQIRLRPATALAVAAAVVLAVALWSPINRPDRDGAAGVPGTVLVQFELRAPAAASVSLAGSFNGWNPEAIPLVRSADPEMWSVTVPLRPGEHEYLFVIDGQEWVPDPRAHVQIDDGFGQSNSVITVGPRGVARS